MKEWNYNIHVRVFKVNTGWIKMVAIYWISDINSLNCVRFHSNENVKLFCCQLFILSPFLSKSFLKSTSLKKEEKEYPDENTNTIGFICIEIGNNTVIFISLTMSSASCRPLRCIIISFHNYIHYIVFQLHVLQKYIH